MVLPFGVIASAMGSPPGILIGLPTVWVAVLIGIRLPGL
jgi:hypothetical protein